MIHRPWLAFLLLFGLFCFTGPYDLHNRDNEAESEGKLQANIAAKGGNIEEGNASLGLGAGEPIRPAQIRKGVGPKRGHD